MVLDGLGRSLRDGLKKISGKGRIDKAAVEELSRDVQRALLKADVDVTLVKEVTSRIKKRALDEDPKGVPAREHVLTVVYEEMMNLLGDESTIKAEPQTIMLVGLQGSGKTTTAGKLARWFQRKGLSVAVISTDTWRPGAAQQLRQLADEVGAEFYGDEDPDDAVAIARRGIQESTADVKIVDTAGRHSLEEELIDEMERIDAEVHPDQKLLVLDASVGKQVKSQAAAFEDAIGITGVVITKLDGTAKGGGALTAVSETGAPIAFIGTGETVDDFEIFEPDGFVSRLLGMGDLKKLARRAEESLSEEDMDVSNIMKGKLTLKDVYNQMESMQKLGPIDQILDMLPIPGGELPTDAADVTQQKLDQFRVIMDSMNDYELENPRKVNSSRVNRIARGSGTSREEVKELLNYHKTMQRTLKQMRGGGARNLMKRLPFG